MLHRHLTETVRVRLLTLVFCGWLTAIPVVGQEELDLSSPEVRAREFAAIAKEAAELERQSRLIRRVVRLVKPTIVHIEAKKDGRRRAIEETGSGIVLKYKGQFYVLTNRHVVKNARLETIFVRLADGTTVSPSEVRDDRSTDVAVLKVKHKGLVAASLGDSRTVDIGDLVMAVGSPFGLSHSVTYGRISAKGRRHLDLGEGVQMQDFIQSDAAINPGNSGGPLINLRGQVIGINTAIASNSGGNEGVGFTIPINMAMAVARQLIDNRGVRRAYLGVTMDAQYNSAVARRLGLRSAAGVHVTKVTPNSPAKQAGLRIDDVIVRYDGEKIDNDDHLSNLVSLTPVGQQVPVLIFRERQFVKLVVKVLARAQFEDD